MAGIHDDRCRHRTRGWHLWSYKRSARQRQELSWLRFEMAALPVVRVAMCGYCFEAAALHYLEGGETEVSCKLSFEPVRLYRPGMAVDREGIAQEWRKIPDDREREITALNLWLRDGDELLTMGVGPVALPCTEEAERLTLNPGDGLEAALDCLNLWFEAVLVPQIARMEMERGKIRRISREEYTYALLLAVHLRRWDDPDWRYLLRRLSLDWGQLEDLAIWSGDDSGENNGPSPAFGDFRLWLRREARLSLWRAGFREEAAFYGERDDFLTFLSWLHLAKEPEAESRIKTVEARTFFIF